MLIAVNKMKTQSVDSAELHNAWHTIDIKGCIPNLRTENYSPIFKALDWRPEGGSIHKDDDEVLVRVGGVVASAERYVIYVGGWSTDITAYTFEVDTTTLFTEGAAFISARIIDIFRAKAVETDIRSLWAWNSLTSYFTRNDFFETVTGSGTIAYHYPMPSTPNRTIAFPVFEKSSATEEFTEVPECNQIDFEEKIEDSLKENLAAVVLSYFNQHTTIAYEAIRGSEAGITYRFQKVHNELLDTVVVFCGFEYTLPGSLLPIGVYLTIDQTAVDLNTGMLNKMSETILRTV